MQLRVLLLLPSPATSIEFDESTLSIDVGESTINEIIETPTGADVSTLTFTSSNTDVATILQDSEDKRKVTITGASAGNVTITATLGNLTATCTVTVTPVALTNIDWSETSITLSPNQETTLTVAYTPENADISNVEFSVANEDLATIISVSDDKKTVVIKAGDPVLDSVTNVFAIDSTTLVEGDLEVNIVI